MADGAVIDDRAVVAPPLPATRAAPSLKAQSQAVDAALGVFYSSRARFANDAASAAERRSTEDAQRLELFARLPDVGISWFVIRGLLMGPLVARRFPAVASRAAVIAVVPAVLELAWFQVRGERRFQSLIPTFTSDTELGAAMREAYASASPSGSSVFADAAARIAQSPVGKGSQFAERAERKAAFASEIALYLEKQSAKAESAAPPTPPRARRVAELDGDSTWKSAGAEDFALRNDFDDEDRQAGGFTMDDTVEDGSAAAGAAASLPSGDSSVGRHAEKSRVAIVHEPVDVFGDLFSADATPPKSLAVAPVPRSAEERNEDEPSYVQRRRRRERMREGSSDRMQ